MPLQNITITVRVTDADGAEHSVTVDAAQLAALAAAAAPAEAPLTSWSAIAAACGVSDDTLARRRRARGDTSPPWFESPAAAREWYSDLVGAHPSPAARTPRRPRREGTGGAVGPTLAERRAER